MEIKFKLTDAAQIEQIPHIRELIVLCHTVNTMHVLRRQILSIDENLETTVSKRDTIYSLVFHMSFLYEAMKNSASMLINLAEIIPREHHADIAWLQEEVNRNPNSYYKKVLEPIRNELGFHFGRPLTRDTLTNSIPNMPPTLVEYHRDDASDLVFVLPTDLIASYFGSLCNDCDDPKAKLILIVKQAAEYFGRVMDILSNSIMYIVANMGDVFDEEQTAS